MPDIRVEKIVKSFGDSPALQEVSFDVQDKEFLTLLGPSGCGKTTTLMSIAGFERPDKGLITCGEETFFDPIAKVDLPAQDRNLGMVFQSYAVWPHMTVHDNVAFPLRIRRMDKSALRARVAETLEMVEMTAYARRYPHEISGGQQQRVALARALVYSPNVLLLDEPFSNLDAKLRERARTWLKQLQGELGITTVFVTHDQDEALSLSDRIVVMDRGTILQTGTPEDIYRRPINRFVAEFLGQCNILNAEVAVRAGGESYLRLQNGAVLQVDLPDLRPGDIVEVAIRPEEINLRSEPYAEIPNIFRAELTSRTFLGDHYLYEIDMSGLPLMVSSAAAVAGPHVVVSVPPMACQTLRKERVAMSSPPEEESQQ